MMNFSFGSGFNLEDVSDENFTQMKKYADYAKSKGITIGTYSLLSSRRISEEDDVINPETGKRGGFARFGNAPCLGSNWGLDYHNNLYKVFDETGVSYLYPTWTPPRGSMCINRTSRAQKLRGFTIPPVANSLQLLQMGQR